MLRDFVKYHDDKIDLQHSPFVPSAVAKARRAKAKQESEDKELEQMKERWLVNSSQIANQEEEERPKNELLAYSVNDDAQMKDYSLENRISVGDLANSGEKPKPLIPNIDETQLDVELSNKMKM